MTKELRVACRALGSCLLLAVSHPAVATDQARPGGPMLVVPFDGGNDPRGAWLGEAVAMLLADDLNAMGGNAYTRDERVRAFERLQLPERARLTHGTIIKIGQLIGASTVISGRLVLGGDDITVAVDAIRIDTGRLTSTFDEHGRLADLLAILERAARRLVPGSTVTTVDVERQHPPLAAYEDFVKGLLAETPATAVGYLEKAIALAPGFDRARLGLAAVQAEAGSWEASRTAALDVPEGSPLKRRAEFTAALAEINLERYDDAFTRLKALADASPAPEIFNNLGVIQLRRGATAQTGKATYYFNKAVQLDPSGVDALFNLGYAYWRDQDNPAALYWLREAVRRDTADADAHFVLAAALDATHASTEAARERELARRLSAGYEQDQDTPAGNAVAPDLERLAEYLRRPGAARPDTLLNATEQREQREMATFHLDRGRRFFDQDDDRNALAELRRAIYLSPYLAEAHLLVGRIHLRAGRTQDAIEALKIAIWSEESAAAHVALGEAYLQGKDTAHAEAEAHRALQLTPGMPDAERLLDRAGAVSSANP
jgi:tetratricopeptide (TPR) repeat protein